MKDILHEYIYIYIIIINNILTASKVFSVKIKKNIVTHRTQEENDEYMIICKNY